MIEFLEKNKRFAVILCIFMAIEIFVISSIPGNAIIPEKIDFSLVYHFVAFFLLNFFLILSLEDKVKTKFKLIALSFCLSTLYAILDEIHQMFVPLRSSSLTDIFVDLIGILASTLVYLYYKKSKKKIKNKVKIKK